MRSLRNQNRTFAALCLLFFGVVSSSCTTTYSKQQISDNS
ncbi:MAG: hypothetical protein ACJA0V_003639, partial [Planctomycetota bacterium]